MRIETVFLAALAFSLHAGPLHAQNYAPYPAPDAGYVTDLANLLSDEDEAKIEDWLYRLEAQKGVEVAVVTIYSIHDYPGADSSSIEAFAGNLFDRYGVGQMPDNTGVLLLIAERDRKARIELGAGYGRSRDGDAMSIMQNKILPSFRKERHDKGIRKGVAAIMEEFGGMRVGWNWELIAVLIALPVTGLIAWSLFRRGKRGWGWVCVGILFIFVLVLFRILFATFRGMSQYSGGGAGGIGGGAAGGFGGGFGGGFSGGGGATGGW